SVLILQAAGMTRSAMAFRRGRVPRGWFGPGWHIGLALVLNLAWALLVVALLPKQFGLSLLILAQGLPDLAYPLLVSGVVAVGWGILRTVWAYLILRKSGEGR